jgi:hypothetical protein
MADMTGQDLAQALRQLSYPSSKLGFRIVRIDAAARNFIADSIELRCRSR